MCWKTVRRNGAPTKMPLTVTGRPASSTDPATWSTHRAAERARIGDGIGFVLGDGIACLDLDGCLDDQGRPNELAREILAATEGAYVEVSPSGRGLHIWGTAAPQPGRKYPGVEVYSTGRYITVTRNVYRSGGLVDLSSFF